MPLPLTTKEDDPLSTSAITVRDHDAGPLLTPSDLAERWSCSTGWLANLRSAGSGPPFAKVGSLVRYPLADVLAYEQAGRVEPVTPGVA